MRPADNINELIKKLQLKASTELDKRVHDDISAALAESEKTKSVLTEPNIWRTIMKSRTSKLAAAAVIIIAVFFGMSVFNNSSGVAWGRVAQNVKQIGTFMFGLTIKVSDPNTEETPDQVTAKWIIYLSEEFGFRMDIWANDNVVSWYVAPNADKMIMVVPNEKELIELPLPANKHDQLPEEFEDPGEYISRFMSRPYKELGRSVIDGIQVEGIEAENPPIKGESLDNAVGRLWVDIETELPVRIEIKGTDDKKTVQWIMDFKWAEAVDQSLFNPNQPNNNTTRTTD